MMNCGVQEIKVKIEQRQYVQENEYSEMKLRQLWEEKHLLHFTNNKHIKKVSILLKVFSLHTFTKNTVTWMIFH